MLTRIKSILFPAIDNQFLVKRTWESGQQQIVLILLDVIHCTRIKQLYGSNQVANILASCAEVIQQSKSFYSPHKYLSFYQSGDEFHIYLALDQCLDIQQLIDLIHHLADSISTQLAGLYPQLEPIQFHKGFSYLTGSHGESYETRLYSSLKEAYTMAKTPSGLEQAQYQNQFNDILKGRSLSTLFQPIVSLHSASILGWEALSRGPAESYFHSPLQLFSFAEKSGLLYHLEQIARESALTSLAKQNVPTNSKIFININPEIINDPDFIGGQTKRLLEELNISPANIVIEITERTCIKDYYSFRKTLEHYRNQGYLIAIDDAGSGYSSLQSIAELKPDYIKIDMSLVKGIHNSMVKQTLLETFVAFSEKINSYLIAEGIEEEEELETLVKLGASYGQGYYIQRPQSTLQPLTKKVETKIILANNEKEQRTYSLNVPISYLCVDTKCYSSQVITREVYDYFGINPDTTGVVILQDQTPVGLVLREKLYTKLGSRYGTSLFIDKPISTVMDPSPLIIDSKTPLDIAAQIAMQRNQLHSHDDIIVVHDQKYLGLVTINAIMLHLSKLNEQKMEQAFAANPLSGLPGNLTIQQQLNSRLQLKKPMAVIYADLDKFKAYNDNYGFESGDEVLRYTASVLVQAVADFVEPNNFIGHIGGDDFIIITTPTLAELISQRVIQLFEERISTFYNQHINIPVMTISLAIVDSQANQFANHFEIAQVAAELKKLAKKQNGSVYVKDRRQSILTCDISL